MNTIISNLFIYLISLSIGFVIGYFISTIVRKNQQKYGTVHYSQKENGVPDLLFEFTKPIEDISKMKDISFHVNIENGYYVGKNNRIALKLEDLEDFEDYDIFSQKTQSL